MKRTVPHAHLTIYCSAEPAYPNAADNRYFLKKAVDIATAILSGIGFVCAMAFLVTMV